MTDAEPDAASILIRLLGPVELSAGSRTATLPQPSQRLLLATLAISGNRVVPTGRLTEALWQEEPTRPRVKNLHTQIYQLRQQLSRLEPGRPAARIVTQPPGYKLVLTATERDIDLVEQQVEQARAAQRAGDAAGAAGAYRQALGHWRGPALADITETSPALRAAADQLDERRLVVLGERIEADLALGRHHELVSELTGLAAQFPLRERTHGQLMLSLYRSGRRADALAAYHAARSVLSEELGLDPGPELTDLHQRILADDPALSTRPPGAGVLVLDRRADLVPADRPAAEENPGPENSPVPPEAPPPAQLPPDLPDFTGRERELAQLAAFVQAAGAAAGSPAVVVITGPGGIGKSALAVRAAHQLRGQFPNGQLFAGLGSPGGNPVSAHDIQARLLRDLGMAPERIPADLQERTATYRTVTSGRRLLIVLDNVQEAAQVRPLLPATAGCAVLVTSRDWLTDVAGGQPLAVPVLDDAASRDLFQSIVGAPRAAAEPAAVTDVLRSCGGLPLAVRIAAARLASRPSWPIRVLADKLADERHRLDALRTGDSAVRASIGVSYDQLSRAGTPGSAAAAAFRTLALAGGPTIGLPAAAALLGLEPDRAEPALESLVDVHLLEAPAADRYRLHDLARIFAAERGLAQDSAASRTAAVRRLLEYYLRSAQSASQIITPWRRQVALGPPPPGCRPLSFSDHDRAMGWLVEERSSLVAAPALAAKEGMDEVAWQLPVTLWELFSLGCYYDDWIATHQTGLAAARRLGNAQAEAWLLTHLGGAYDRTEALAPARTCYEQALSIRRHLGDERGQAVLLLNLGMIWVEDDQLATARAHLEEAAAICRRIGHQAVLGGALHHLGKACWLDGEPARAIEFMREAVSVLREAGNRYGESGALLDLSRCLLDTGQPGEAVEWSRQAIAVSADAGSLEEAAMARVVLALALAATGREPEARQAWAETADGFDALGDPLGAQIRSRLNTPGQDPAEIGFPRDMRPVRGR